jgi:hypothetical protein
LFSEGLLSKEKEDEMANQETLPNLRDYILNCDKSLGVETDWTYQDAVDATLVRPITPPSEKDLRAKWWEIRDQGNTGACVGFACADGVLHYHYEKAGLIDVKKGEKPSPRFIWMANKETDAFTSYPTTFLELAGTQTKLALDVARKFGCVLDDDLPMKGGLSILRPASFYAKATRLRIASYYNLGTDSDVWRNWLASQGPILTRLNVDDTWYAATRNEGRLDTYDHSSAGGGHAVCLVGYTKDSFIVRNSWGKGWGDKGFAYVSSTYAEDAFTEAYGAVMP